MIRKLIEYYPLKEGLKIKETSVSKEKGKLTARGNDQEQGKEQGKGKGLSKRKSKRKGKGKGKTVWGPSNEKSV